MCIYENGSFYANYTSYSGKNTRHIIVIQIVCSNHKLCSLFTSRAKLTGNNLFKAKYFIFSVFIEVTNISLWYFIRSAFSVYGEADKLNFIWVDYWKSHTYGLQVVCITHKQFNCETAQNINFLFHSRHLERWNARFKIFRYFVLYNNVMWDV